MQGEKEKGREEESKHVKTYSVSHSILVFLPSLFCLNLIMILLVVLLSKDKGLREAALPAQGHVAVKW